MTDLSLFCCLMLTLIVMKGDFLTLYKKIYPTFSDSWEFSLFVVTFVRVTGT